MTLLWPKKLLFAMWSRLVNFYPMSRHRPSSMSRSMVADIRSRHSLSITIVRRLNFF